MASSAMNSLVIFFCADYKRRRSLFPWGSTRKGPVCSEPETGLACGCCPRCSPRGRLPCRLWRREQPFPPLSVPSLPNFLPLPGPGPSPGVAERPEPSPCSSTSPLRGRQPRIGSSAPAWAATGWATGRALPDRRGWVGPSNTQGLLGSLQRQSELGLDSFSI